MIRDQTVLAWIMNSTRILGFSIGSCALIQEQTIMVIQKSVCKRQFAPTVIHSSEFNQRLEDRNIDRPNRYEVFY